MHSRSFCYQALALGAITVLNVMVLPQVLPPEWMYWERLAVLGALFLFIPMTLLVQRNGWSAFALLLATLSAFTAERVYVAHRNGEGLGPLPVSVNVALGFVLLVMSVFAAAWCVTRRTRTLDGLHGPVQSYAAHVLFYGMGVAIYACTIAGTFWDDTTLGVAAMLLAMLWVLVAFKFDNPNPYQQVPDTTAEPD